MRLEIWMQLENVTASELATKLNVPQSYVHRYVYENAIPRRQVMKRLYMLTLGAVRADDFYELDSQLFVQELKRQQSNRNL